MLEKWLSQCKTQAEKEWLLRIVSMAMSLKCNINLRRIFKNEDE